jgi:hypothetical protein
VLVNGFVSSKAWQFASPGWGVQECIHGACSVGTAEP